MARPVYISKTTMAILALQSQEEELLAKAVESIMQPGFFVELGEKEVGIIEEIISLRSDDIKFIMERLQREHVLRLQSEDLLFLAALDEWQDILKEQQSQN